LLKKLNFIANIIQNEKEKEELFNILKAVFDSQIEATLLLENGIPKICNKKFVLEFGSCDFFDKLKTHINFDTYTTTQIIEINNHEKRIFEVRIKKIDEKYTILYLHNITNYENEIFYDELTKVYNRKYLNKILEKSLNKKMCVILCDIDHFKHINDNFGHPKGDEVLKIFANLLKNNLRKNDIVIRIGGEEFLIIFDGVEQIEIATKIAEHLREKIENFDFNGIKVTSSFGVCCKYIHNYEDFAKLYQLTDKALYNAKKEGRNRVKVCE
jgi:diguanylate cyclase (GGDEF)-like protein